MKILLFITSLLLSIALQAQTFTTSVATGADDAEEEIASGTCNISSSDLELINDYNLSSSEQIVGIRFTNIDIPANATITNAYIQLTVDETTTTSTNLTIKGELTENSQTFSTNSANISSRTNTNASVDWNSVPAWSGVGDAGVDQKTPDLSSVVTEIMTHNSWSQGNALTFFITGSGQRIAESYDGSSADAPELIIEYTLVVYDNDLAINIINPNTSILPNASVSIEVEVTNLGNNTQSNFDVSYSVDNGTTTTETTSLNLAQGETGSYTFTQTADMSVPNTYNVNAEVILSSDEYIANNSTSENVTAESANVDDIHWGSTNDPLNGLTITWRSNGSADQIKWGYTIDYNEGTHAATSSSSWNPNTLFNFTFPDGVTPEATIHYSIYNSDIDGWTADKTFATSKSPAASTTQYSFTVLGDSRTNLSDWQSVANATEENEFAIFVGDIVEDGSNESQWNDWFSYGDNLVSDNLIYHSFGNHDGLGSPNFTDLYTLPGDNYSYSYEYGNAIFIFIYMEDASHETDLAWLQNTLANTDKTWKFVTFHRPFFTSGGHAGEMDSFFDTWWQAFDDYSVDMVFNGHTHNYQRSKPINRNISTSAPVSEYGSEAGQGRCQIITGGAGAPMVDTDPSKWWFETGQRVLHYCTVDIDGEQLSFKAIDANDNIIDEFIITKTTDPIATWSPLEFNESIVNNGSIDNSISVLLENGAEFSTTGQLTEGTHFNTSNIPSGLSVNINVLDNTNSTITLTGSAALHESINNISDLGISFTNAAFNSLTASQIINSSRNDISVNYLNAPQDQMFADYDNIDLDFSIAWGSGTAFTEINNTISGGINTSGRIGQVVNSGSNTYDGVAANLSNKIIFGPNSIIKMKVYAPNTGTIILKLEDQADANVNAERYSACSTTGTWEELTFDFSGEPSNTYNKIVLMFNAGTADSETYYFDDIELIANPTSSNPIITWSGADFNESANGNIGNSISVLLENGAQFATTGPLTEDTHFTVSNIPQGLTASINVIDNTNAEISLQGSADSHENSNSISNFGISFTDNAFSGYAASEIQNSTKTDISINFFDDATNQMFADYDNIDLIFEGFGGNDFAEIYNPYQTGINTSDSVGYTNSGSEVWAGIAGNLSNTIVFGPNTVIRMKVYAPKICKITIKLEDHTDANINHAVQLTNTQINNWEEMEFDFSGAQSNTYDKIVIFFDIDSTHVNPYYFDDIELIADPTITSTQNVINNSSVIVYPNPFNNNITINTIDAQNINIYNSIGKLVFSSKINSRNQEIDLSELNNGLYILRVYSKSGIIQTKIIKK